MITMQGNSCEVQKLETVGIDYDSKDIFLLLESGWNVNYAKSTMSAWRYVPQQENKDQLQDARR